MDLNKTTTPTPTSPALLVRETAVSPPTEVESPGWSTEVQRAVHPTGDPSSVGSVSLAAILAEMQADRVSRQVESARSQERLDRLEDWLRQMSGRSGEGGRTGEVPDASWYRSPGPYRSGLPSRRESIVSPLSGALPEEAVFSGFPNAIPPLPNTSTRTVSVAYDSDLGAAPKKVANELKDWLKTAQKVTTGAAARKYDGKYWDLWKREMLIALREAKLHKFIAADFVPPESDPNSLIWHQFVEGDPIVQRFILNHLSEEKAQALAFMSTGSQMWDHLLSTEEGRTENDVRRMMHEWETLKQEPSETVQTYIRRIDLAAARLMEMNRVKDEADKLYKLLYGLGPHWDSQKAAFRVNSSNQKYKEVCATLLGIAVERGEVGGDMAAGGEAHFSVGTNNERGQYRGKSNKVPFVGVFCFGCGSRDHHTGSCSKVTLEKLPNGKYPQNCYYCLKLGHISRYCPEKKSGVASGGGSSHSH